MAKKVDADLFLEWWKSDTTRNVLTIWAPILGYVILVPVADWIGRNRDMPAFKGNVATLYSAAVVTNMVNQVASGLGIKASELAAIFMGKKAKAAA